MVAFASFFADFIWTLIKNIGNFFASIGIAIYDLFIRDIGEYFSLLGKHAGGFDALGWIFLIIFILVNTAFVGFLFYRIGQFIRRYIVYRAKNVRKDKIMEEVAKLQLEAEKLEKEQRQKSLAERIKEEAEPVLEKVEKVMGDEGAPPAQPKDQSVRFTALLEVDKTYEESPSSVRMAEADLISLKQIVKNAVAFSASTLNLYYADDTIRQYLAALATSKIVIVQGITGAGKTTLPYAMGCYFNHEPMIVPVSADWRDRADFLGYYDETNNQYVETAYLAEIYAATHRQDPSFIVLDEMNLARTEYYFSDILSLMDVPDVSEWKINLVPAVSTNDPKNMSYGKLLIPQNIWFVGTANTDDATFAISDDVYERAMMIELNQIEEPFTEDYTEPVSCSAGYLQSLFDKAQLENPVHVDNMHRIEDLDTFLGQRFAVKFGTRLMKQMTQFVPVYVACGGKEVEGLDIFVRNKVLPKLVPLNLKFLVRELNDLIVWLNRTFGNNKMRRCVEYVEVLQKVN